MHETIFSHLAEWTARQCGRAATFIAAIFVVLLWVITGPIFHWSDTWQLVINSITSVVTFLMVFLIQSTQNRDAEAVRLKLDELLSAARAGQREIRNIEERAEPTSAVIPAPAERVRVARQRR